ncbi:polyketide cyclase [Nocardiopsis sp. CNR-923]|uniref:SRPBCC family protein n=1 Tax=Nocardiopsis sp. CNR-923 TaxID=1904965 RepID=UPI00096009C7|nr:SRPBCC family protein [Nocardiopsis sp. CNR-923]OLT26138.1 polyketide cyclase [Nocardiopsis sp. CNR-923]
MSARTEATVVIDAPMDLVWDMTNDVESWPELFTEYAEAEILERRGDTVRFRLALHPDEDGKVWSWVSERTPDRESRTVRAHRVETGPFEFMNIYWEYLPVDGGVEMRWVQEFHVKDEMPFDDDAMAEHIRTNTAEQMPHIKEQVEKAARNRSS